MLPQILTPIPGPRSLALAARLRRHESRNVTYLADDFPVFWQRAEGVNVWDADGNRFLDLTSAFGVSGLGHTDAAVRTALVAQSGELLHAMGDVHPTALKAGLCARLSALTFERWGAGDAKTVLSSSGSDAVETALKTALLRTGKAGVIAFAGGYHGLGLGALSAIGLPFFREPFRAQLKDFATLLPYPHCYRCPFGRESGERLGEGTFPACLADCLMDLRGQIEATLREKEIGCILVEPIQGRGGCVVPPREFLPMLREICDTHGILLIADEIYTGFNRTGALFACEHSGVVPDLICLGKALTGGFPLSACVGHADVMDAAWPAGTGEAIHTSTFLGHPVGCAMALANIGELRAKKLVQRSARLGEMLLKELSKVQGPKSKVVCRARGVGLMAGIELLNEDSSPATELSLRVIKKLLHRGLILLPEGEHANVISFTPPLTISEAQLRRAAAALRKALDEE